MNSDSLWQPTASIENLRTRARLLIGIRHFFNERRVLEVETPVLSQYGATDVHLLQWQTTEGFSLHTSPEFAMKRLLASGSGDIFQICRVFRHDEVSQRHNPEFTMLEWYRVGWNEHQLMAEVVELINAVAGGPTIPYSVISYRDAFLAANLPDPHNAEIQELRESLWVHTNSVADAWSRDDCLEALMALVVEPDLPKDELCFVHKYPASQAALACHGVDENITIGRRFEMYWQGMELANGYFELTDSEEQKRRFKQDSDERVALNLPQPEIDSRFIDALDAGMPSCSGVALGVDRLMMILLKVGHISEVIAFPVDRA